MAAKQHQLKTFELKSHQPQSWSYLPKRDLLSLQGSQIEVLRLRCRKESFEVQDFEGGLKEAGS